MGASNTKGVKVCVIKDGVAPVTLAFTAATKAKPSVVTVADVTGLSEGDIITLAADTKKGTRASFTKAAAPEMGEAYFARLVELCRERLGAVETGRFGANMQVALTNDGPVTFWLET